MSGRKQILERLHILRVEVAALEVEAARLAAEEPTPNRLSGRYDIDENGCWVWLGKVNRGGYGKISIAGKQWLAHRYSWTVTNGEIGEGLTIDHLCFNTLCVNVGHLRTLSHVENSRGQRKSDRDVCINGHRMTDENTMFRADGAGDGRRCKTCEFASRARSAAFRKARELEQRTQFGEQLASRLDNAQVVLADGQFRTYVYVYVAELRLVLQTKGNVVVVGSNHPLGLMSEGAEVIADRLTSYMSALSGAA